MNYLSKDPSGDDQSPSFGGGYRAGERRARDEKINQPRGRVRTEDDGVIGVNIRAYPEVRRIGRTVIILRVRVHTHTQAPCVPAFRVLHTSPESNVQSRGGCVA